MEPNYKANNVSTLGLMETQSNHQKREENQSYIVYDRNPPPLLSPSLATRRAFWPLLDYARTSAFLCPSRLKENYALKTNMYLKLTHICIWQ